MKKEIILVGGGGHCRSCIDVIEQGDEYRIAGIVDAAAKLHQYVLGYEIIAADEDIPALARQYDFLVTVGQIKSAQVRERLFQAVKKAGGRLPVIVSPLAYVSRHARLGEGTIVMHQALINAGARVGSNCIINTKALIEHDAEIGDHCHIATGARINGGVIIGAGSFWGSGAVARECVEVGENSIVGAGATVKRDEPPQSVIR